MKLIAPVDAYIVALGHSVEAGQVIDVPSEHVDGLREQGWKPASKDKDVKSPATDAPAGADKEL